MPTPSHILLPAAAAIVLLAGPAAPGMKMRDRPVADRGAAAQPAHAISLRRDTLRGPIPAIVTRIIDGDTFEARVRVWFGTEITTLVRIRGFDAPELKARCPAEATRAALAKEALGEYLATGPVTLDYVALDKYGGRVLANVAVADAAAPAEPLEDIAALMLASGLARPYKGGRRESWCGPLEGG